MPTIDKQRGEKKEEPKLFIYPFSNPEKPGDVILRADNGTGIYASLSPLAKLSSFFRNLPKDLKAEEHEGAKVIPLAGTSGEGLRLVVQAATSLFGARRCDFEEADESILEAAVCAKVYDVPVIFRILIDCVSDDWTKFAVAAIGDVEDDLQLIAQRLLSFDLLSIPQTTIQILKRHANHNWERLKDLLLRQHFALGRFRTEIRAHEDWIADGHEACNDCGLGEGDDHCKMLLIIEDRRAIKNLWDAVGSEVCACWPEWGRGLHNIVRRYLEYSEVTLRKDPWL